MAVGSHSDEIDEISGFVKLPDSFRQNTYEYTLIKREGDVAIYAQWCEGRIIAYEVYEVKKIAAQNLNGYDYPAKETSPSSSQWGNNAFTVWTLEKAEEKFRLIKRNLENKKERDGSKTKL